MHEKLHEIVASSFTAYLWVIVISIWGGIAGYIGKIKRGHTRFSIAELIGELVISAFVGVITYLFCQAAQIDELIAAAMVGIAGHMGSRAILMMEKAFQTKIEAWFSK